jgi:hypothetical protein
MAAAANPVCYYLTHTLVGIPAAASRAITEEGMEEFEDLIGISDEHVQAIIKNSRKCFYDAAAAGRSSCSKQAPHHRQSCYLSTPAGVLLLAFA